MKKHASTTTEFTISNWSKLPFAANAEDLMTQKVDCALCFAPHQEIHDRKAASYFGISDEVTAPDNELKIRNSEQIATRISASYVTRLHNATIFPSANIVVSEDSCIQSDSFRALGHLLNEGFTELQDRRFSKNIRIDGEIFRPSILLGIQTNRNYFHWLLEAMPRLLLADKHGLISQDTLIVTPKMTPWMREIFDFYGFGKFQILENDNMVYRFTDLIIPARGIENIRTFTHHALLASQKINFERRNPARKLFISRSKSASRRMTNEGEVYNIAEKFGYEIIFPENYSFSEQARIFSDATHVAGCLGAGLTNMIFNRSPAALVEFSPEGRTGDATLFANMAEAWDSKYACVIGPFSGAMNRGIDRRDFKVSTEQAEMAFQSVD